jgi:hypothetical protein
LNGDIGVGVKEKVRDGGDARLGEAADTGADSSNWAARLESGRLRRRTPWSSACVRRLNLRGCLVELICGF